MKTMKRFLAGMVAVASVMAIAPMSAFADTEIKQDSTNKTGGMVVSYLKSAVSPTFTITIPATVDLNSTTRTANITAEGVYLNTDQHKQINVTLNEASHTASGTTFHAQNTAGDSTATYTINNGTKDIAVGDVVASFANNPDTTADPDVQTATITFSAPTGATYAGTHTETLTFGIAVENAVVTPKTYPSLKTGDILHVGDIVTSADGYSFKNYWYSFPKNKSFKLVRADISIRGSASVTESDTGAYYVFLNLDYNEGDRNRNFGLEEVEEQEGLEDLTGKVIFKATETSDGLEVTVENDAVISVSVPSAHTLTVAAPDGVTVTLDGVAGNNFSIDRLSEPTLAVNIPDGQEIVKIVLNGEDVMDKFVNGQYKLPPVYENLALEVETKAAAEPTTSTTEPTTSSTTDSTTSSTTTSESSSTTSSDTTSSSKPDSSASSTTTSSDGGTSNSNSQNTYPNNDSPNTGDAMAVGIGVPAFFLGVAFLMVLLKKRNKDEE